MGLWKHTCFLLWVLLLLLLLLLLLCFSVHRKVQQPFLPAKKTRTSKIARMGFNHHLRQHTPSTSQHIMFLFTVFYWEDNEKHNQIEDGGEDSRNSTRNSTFRSKQLWPWPKEMSFFAKKAFAMITSTCSKGHLFLSSANPVRGV